MYEKQVQEMGLETTPLPLPPPSATFKTKIPDINLTKGNLNTMEIDDEHGMEDFAAEIAAISWDSEDECEFQGFCRSAHAARNIEEEGKEGEKKRQPIVQNGGVDIRCGHLNELSTKVLGYLSTK